MHFLITPSVRHLLANNDFTTEFEQKWLFNIDLNNTTASSFLVNTEQGFSEILNKWLL